MQILIIEDEERLAQLLQKGLQKEGFIVEIAQSGDEAMRKLVNKYDLLLLDLMIPGIDGITLIEKLRGKKDQTPVLILTAKDSLSDKIKGLNIGADDYLTKPFDFDELLARIHSIIRRTKKSETILQLDTLTINPRTKEVQRAGKTITLSITEYRLLEYLLYHKEQILNESTLLEHAWDHAYDGLSNIVSVYIRYLRNKIEKPFPKEKKVIHTIRGRGYILSDKKYS